MISTAAVPGGLGTRGSARARAPHASPSSQTGRGYHSFRQGCLVARGPKHGVAEHPKPDYSRFSGGVRSYQSSIS